MWLSLGWQRRHLSRVWGECQHHSCSQEADRLWLMLPGLSSSFFTQSVIPTHMVPTFRMGSPSSVKQPWKPPHWHAHICLLADYKFQREHIGFVLKRTREIYSLTMNNICKPTVIHLFSKKANDNEARNNNLFNSDMLSTLKFRLS